MRLQHTSELKLVTHTPYFAPATLPLHICFAWVVRRTPVCSFLTHPPLCVDIHTHYHTGRPHSAQFMGAHFMGCTSCVDYILHDYHMPDSVAHHSMNPPYDVCSPLVCNSECMRVIISWTALEVQSLLVAARDRFLRCSLVHTCSVTP